ncbi:MAG: DNA polymerase III subunit alpha [Candidatus Azobacteroides sp.]|nr:DNA polymerase III subunit alpha [Candidatus Azobacteroides sp.]
MEPFIHLHVHSYYSVLDGQASVSSLVDKAYKDGMRAIALTDHGNMYGIKDFFNYVSKKNKPIKDEIKKLSGRIKEAEEANPVNEAAINELKQALAAKEKELFKPILGCEAYVARNGRHKKAGKEDLSGYHLILLAKNKTGYHNLVKLISLGFMEGFYGRPRIDKEILEKYKEGLIVCSACLGGEIPKMITAGRMEDAEKAVMWHKNLFGDDYYLEFQRHETYDPSASQDVFPLQVEVNKGLMQLAKKCNVKIIATNDVHFANQEDAEAHDRLICLVTNSDIDDPKRMRYTKQEWLKSQEEMNKIFSDLPEALRNTLEIAEKVEFYDINSGPIMPNFPLPDGFENDDDYLRYLTFEGAKKRYGETLTEEQQERLDFELSTIKNMGFPGYFLIVQDFIQAAKDMGTAVGPGRGSAAGSAVAYCLGITDIDPIKYDLLFERFLNPDRISMPDIDIDFDDDGRGEVLRWVTQKYGKEKVAHIITFGTMATKSSIKDVARIQKLPLSESDRLSKLVPDRIPDKKVNLRTAIEYVPELKAAAQSPDPVLRDTLKYAQMLEGTIRNTGVHACGIIIGKDDLTNFIPIGTTKDKETGEEILVSQYEGTVIEEVGMLKMDFLGLKTLSIIKEALENIENTRGEKLDFSNMEKIIHDKKTYELYSAGKTTGTFQFESPGMQKYLKELEPSTFEDLIAMNALYRPGPMDYIPSFVARKHGRESISYDIPIMERYLKDTYGITVYQEQVMLLSRLLANFTRGQSDELRKAMGKKLKDKMDTLKVKFIDGAKANGHDPKICEKIWSDWEKFASYAFNKSHATCYSWVAFQTAYLKANYPSEYMAAVLSRNLSQITEITKFMDECKAMNIEVLGPDVNESFLKFSVNKKGNIRFGLGAIKGVGESAVDSIINERKKNGPFKNIFDFVERVNLNACNKKNIEALAMAGAFDNFPEMKREQFFAQSGKDKEEAFIETLIRYGNKFQTDKASSLNSLFGGDNSISVVKPPIPPLEEWSDIERLNRERELVGIYLSAHPLDRYYIALNYGCNTHMKDFDDKSRLVNKKELVFGGIITNVRQGKTKQGRDFAIVRIEDYSGSGEIPFFGNDFVQYRHYLHTGYTLLFKGKYQPRRYNDTEFDLSLHSIEMLDDVHEKLIDKITINLPLDIINKELINDLSVLLKQKPGNAVLFFKVTDPETNMNARLFSRYDKVNLTKDITDQLKEYEHISFSIN